MVLSVLQTAAIAFLGYGFLDLSARTASLARGAPAEGVAPFIRTETSAATAAEIRAVVREELAALRAEPAATREAALPDARPDAQPVAAPTRTPAVEANAVRRELEAHLARGWMSNVDVEQFLTKAAELPPDERERMMSKLTAAINSGRLDARL